MTIRFKIIIVGQQSWSHWAEFHSGMHQLLRRLLASIDKAYESGEFALISTGTTWLSDNIKELDVYVEELEGNSIYEIGSKRLP